MVLRIHSSQGASLALKSAVGATVVGFCLAFAPGALQAAPVGQLDCAVSGGIGFVITSSRALNCQYRPLAGGPPHHYVGTIHRFGLDIGVQGPGHLVWTVISAGLIGQGALAGDYAGASASVTAGVGLGANALIGGNGGAFTLQPVSVQTQSGFDLAAGVGEMSLERVP
jgi:hypothetical protein